MVQIFGLELISSPRVLEYLGARGILSKFRNSPYSLVGYKIKSISSLEKALRLLRKQKKSDAPLIIISAHGAYGFIRVGTSIIRLSDLLSMNPGLFTGSWLHLSYCNSLTVPVKTRKYLVDVFSLRQLSGYKRSPLWEDSFENDLAVVKEFIAENRDKILP